MDDRTYRIAVVVLVGAILAVLAHGTLPGFQVPNGFWTVLAAVAAFLGARSALKGDNR